MGDYIQHDDDDPIRVCGVGYDMLSGPVVRVGEATGPWCAMLDGTKVVKDPDEAMLEMFVRVYERASKKDKHLVIERYARKMKGARR